LQELIGQPGFVALWVMAAEGEPRMCMAVTLWRGGTAWPWELLTLSTAALDQLADSRQAASFDVTDTVGVSEIHYGASARAGDEDSASGSALLVQSLLLAADRRLKSEQFISRAQEVLHGNLAELAQEIVKQRRRKEVVTAQLAFDQTTHLLDQIESWLEIQRDPSAPKLQAQAA